MLLTFALVACGGSGGRNLPKEDGKSRVQLSPVSCQISTPPGTTCMETRPDTDKVVDVKRACEGIQQAKFLEGECPRAGHVGTCVHNDRFQKWRFYGMDIDTAKANCAKFGTFTTDF